IARADHVEHGRRLGRDEADCRPDHRRHDHFDHPCADYYARHFLHHEAPRAAARPVARVSHDVGSPGMMSAESRKPHASGEHDADAMVREMRAPWLWTNASVILLGLWLISSPWTFGYRSAAMTWSDVASGALLVVLAAAAFVPRYDFYGRWGVALVGTWLQFAPLVFWAPTPAAYITDTLIGVLAITLSILVPMMPGMAH